MKEIFILFIIQLVFLFCSLKQVRASEKRLSDYVNPMIGASTSEGEAGVYHALGKTYPGATSPFGMVQISPNTITGGDNGSGYSNEHQSIVCIIYSKCYIDYADIIASGVLELVISSNKNAEWGLNK